MSSVYPWIYVDDTNNIWKFSINDNEELRYNIMYDEGKWTKENLIDIHVLGFAVHIDEDELVHIVYSNINGDLKYCTMRNKQWVGKTLYHLESDEFEIRNLSIKIIAEEMHIFYMLIANDGSDHAVLMHCRWNGNIATVNSLQDIILIPSTKKHYVLHVNNRNKLDLFFITDEGDEASLQCSSFQNNKWTTMRRLYGIQGDDISFEVVSDEQNIHILNRSRESSTYLLDHVSIDINGNIRGFKVFESNSELEEPLLINLNDNLYSCWIEENRIFYSAFDNEKWGIPVCLDKANVGKLKRYDSLIIHDGKSLIKSKSIYGTVGPDLDLFIPKDFIKEIRDSSNYTSNKDGSSSINEIGEVQSIKAELQKFKIENTNLEKKIASLNMQLQKKQRLLEDYEETIARILDQKRKVEENYKIYLEVQQNNKKELERIRQQLSDESQIKSDFEKKLNASEEENKSLKMQIETIIEENNTINTQFKNILNDNEMLRVEFRKVKEANELLELEFKNINTEKKLLEKRVYEKNEENIRLLEELEFEKNQTIMDRLLRRRSSEV